MLLCGLAQKIGTENLSAGSISEEVIRIRKQKLPDPELTGNAGSFFKNPVISNDLFQKIKKQYPDIPGYGAGKKDYKLSAGWLIETAGFKGKRFGNYGVHARQALVLVNHGGAKGHELLQLARLIQEAVKRIFDITLEPEVNII